ncbi:MAG: hypothetical protein GY842_24360 [bacterium]|nr:hypothetical protein [bacterium]
MRPVIEISTTVMAVVLLLNITSVSLAGTWPPAEITISPETPTDADSLTITITGEWGSSCVPVNPVTSQFSQTIAVTAAPIGEICLTVITPYTLEVELAPLSEGAYTIEYYVDEGGPFPSLLATLNFNVTSSVLFSDGFESGDTSLWSFQEPPPNGP